jgi:hypothetical protein
LSSSIFLTCPDCGAECSASSRKCWMCGRLLAAKGTAGVAAGENVFVTTPESSPPRRAQLRVAQPRPTQHAVDNATLAVMSVGLLIVGAGVAHEAPGLGTTYIVIILPALIATFVKRRRRLRSNQTPGWGDTVADFIGGIAIAIGLLIVLPLVAVLALALYCAVANPSFR